MLVNEFWKVFENTGSLEAYLYCKKDQEIVGPEKEQEQEYPVAANDNIVK